MAKKQQQSQIRRFAGLMLYQESLREWLEIKSYIFVFFGSLTYRYVLICFYYIINGAFSTNNLHQIKE
jgi:hypothetical protein